MTPIDKQRKRAATRKKKWEDAAKAETDPAAEPPAPAGPVLRDRIIELRRVKASQIAGAPWNWREHPDTQKQQLADSIEELGFFDPLDTRELPDGRLELIDGHARRDLIDSRIGPDTLIPCIVTDFTEAEAKKANLYKDPLAAGAVINQEKFAALRAQVETNSVALQEMLAKLAMEGMPASDSGDGAGGDSTGTEVAMRERWDILIECGNEQQQAELLERLAEEGLKVRSLIA